MKADMIITRARVLTMDTAAPRAEAVAIGGQSIMAVGTTADMNDLRGPATRVIDAAGATLLPGFIESHMHVFPGGVSTGQLDLMGLKGLDRITARVRAHAAANTDDRLIYVRGIDYDMLGGAPIDRHVLDAIIADRPMVFVAFDIHTMWANTRALEVTGLLQGRKLGPGNEIVMASDGLASGELREFEAFAPINVYSGAWRSDLGLSTGGEPDPAPAAADRDADRRAIRRGLDWCARHGITSIHNMDGNLYQLELLKEIEAEGDLSCRIKVPFHFKNFMELDMLSKASSMRDVYRGDWISSGLVKAFYDGVMEGYTAVMLGDYADRPGWRGEALFTPERFAEFAIAADRLGLQIAVHCCGDGAVRAVLDGYEAAARANGQRDARHRVEHVEVIHPDDIPRFRALGAIASMQPPHPPGVMDFPREPGLTRMGPARWPLAYAWRTLKDAGAHVVFSSDWPVARVDVMAGLHAAVTRRPWADGLPDQRFTLIEALAAYTREGAWAEHAENRKGMLRAGYLADLVLLSGDIEAVPFDDLPALQPVMTICGGRITYQA